MYSPRVGGSDAVGRGARRTPARRRLVCSWQSARNRINRQPRPCPPPGPPFQSQPADSKTQVGTSSNRTATSVICLLVYFSLPPTTCKVCFALCTAFPARAAHGRLRGIQVVESTGRIWVYNPGSLRGLPTSLPLQSSPRAWCFFRAHFTDGETEAQRGENYLINNSVNSSAPGFVLCAGSLRS